MTSARLAVAALSVALLIGACDYIVVPPEDGAASSGENLGWSALATGVTPADGGLRIDLTIRNETGDWSSMAALADKPALLTLEDGSTVECPMVVVGSGGHRLPPGFQMRGFIAGPKTDPREEDIRVECAGVTDATGGRLAIDYGYDTGDYDYYATDASRREARLEVPMDPLATDLTYPIAQPVDGLLLPPDTAITAINDVVLTLTGVERVGDTLTMAWQTTNPGEYPSYVHIGDPPVIGSDGVLYGFYESPDLASVPVTPAAGEATWATDVDVPAAVMGLVIPLSVESRKARTFVHYAIDLSGT